jgi:hypothetical protein
MFRIIQEWLLLPRRVSEVKSLLEVLLSSDPRALAKLARLQNSPLTSQLTHRKPPEPAVFLPAVDDETMALFEEEMELLMETNPSSDQELLSQQAWRNALNRSH